MLKLALATTTLAGTLVASVAMAEPVTLTDLAGRSVTIETPVERAILGEGRMLYGLTALLPDGAVDNVVGWRDDMKQFDPRTFEAYSALFPKLDQIAEVGRVNDGSFSVEQAIALDADVVLLPLDVYRAAIDGNVLDQLEGAGIPAVFVDFRERPLDNTVPSTLLLGRVFGEEERAQEVVDFYLAAMNQVYGPLAGFKGERPRVFLERGAGYDDHCCNTWGSESFGLMVERAGGINVGSEFLPGATGTLNPEQVRVSDPDVVIYTAADWSKANPMFAGIPHGAGAEPALVQERLRGMTERPAYVGVKAVEEGRVHSLWHQFYNSPYNFAAFQAIAKWTHPELFADLDPDATFAAFHERFLPIPYDGGYFASLDVTN